MKKSLEQRLRETDPELIEYLERLVAQLQAAFQKIKETEPGPDLQELREPDKNPSFYIDQQAFERTPAFKQFHEKTGGDLWDFMDTPDGEIDFTLQRLFAIAEAFHSPSAPAISVTPRFHKGRYLDVCIDLSKSKEALRASFEEILSMHHGWVEHPRTPRGEKWPDSIEEINRIFHAYDVVEKHGGNYLKATWELFPETNGEQAYIDSETDRNLQQVKRWHKKVKRRISAL